MHFFKLYFIFFILENFSVFKHCFTHYYAGYFSNMSESSQKFLRPIYYTLAVGSLS